MPVINHGSNVSEIILILVLVTQLYPILCDRMDCSPSGSSVHGILQVRILEWVAISFSRGSSPPRDQIQVSDWATREAAAQGIINFFLFISLIYQLEELFWFKWVFYMDNSVLCRKALISFLPLGVCISRFAFVYDTGEDLFRRSFLSFLIFRDIL